MPFSHSMPVLVVDDSRTVVSVVRKLLHQLGFSDVDDADDGASALEKLGTKSYGLVISDWNMQTMNGYEFLRRVRETPELKRLPFIMMTTEVDKEKVIAAKKAGVDNYIVKPFNTLTLRAKIETVYSARNAHVQASCGG